MIEICAECKGRGFYLDESNCVSCDGRGSVGKNGTPCGYCAGRGCPACQSTGWKNAELPIALNLPIHRVSAKRLREVGKEIVLDGQYQDRYEYGLFAGLLVQSLARSEQGGEQGRLMRDLLKDGQVSVAEDGIYHSARSYGTKVVKFSVT